MCLIVLVVAFGKIIIYRTLKECVEKVVYYLNYPDKTELLARAGRLWAEKEHSWEKRFNGLFKKLRII